VPIGFLRVDLQGGKIISRILLVVKGNLLYIYIQYCRYRVKFVTRLYLVTAYRMQPYCSLEKNPFCYMVVATLPINIYVRYNDIGESD
jgi:hypothetical protein